MNPTLRTILSIAAVLEIPAGQFIQEVQDTLGPGWKAERGGGGS